MSELTDRLRVQIDGRHAKVLEALQLLSDYLDDPNLLNGQPPPANNTVPPATRRRRGRNKGESLRDRVLAVIRSDWATVPVMMTKTGLAVNQVRGVINAPGLTARIEKRNSANGVEYHLRPESAS